MKLWRNHYDHDMWYSLCDLPTGWTAMVSDHSQAKFPQGPTEYTISASSRLLHISWCETFISLQDARRESLKKALVLPQAPETNEEARHQFHLYAPKQQVAIVRKTC
jgi:hypothetical protein